MNARSSTRAPLRFTERTCALWSLIFLLLASGAPLARADVVLEETFDLTAGWNLIHIAVEPVEKDVATALSGLDWESTWAWLEGAGGKANAERGGRWLARHRNEPAFLSTLASFAGPASYAIRIRSPGTLRVKGYVRPDRGALERDMFQLFGPRVASSSSPTVADYFSRPGVFENIGSVYELSDGGYRKLGASDPLRRGAAYWVRPTAHVPEPHPLRIEAGFGGLRFDAQTTLQEIELDLGSASGGSVASGARRLYLRTIPSADGGSAPDWLDIEEPDGTFAPLTAETSIELDSEATRVRLALRARDDEISRAEGSRRALAIEIAGPSGSVLVAADLDLATLEGTWTGEAFLSEVERPSFHGGGYAPVERLPLAIILDIPRTGRPQLLPCIEVEGNRDARRTSYRLEAALFHQPVELFGTVGDDGRSGALAGTLALSPEHPLNPYRHRYHAEHRTGFDITRSVELRFGASVPGSDVSPEAESPFATVGVLAGVYEEEIVGLAQEPIRVRGVFRLRRLPDGSASPCASAGE